MTTQEKKAEFVKRIEKIKAGLLAFAAELQAIDNEAQAFEWDEDELGNLIPDSLSERLSDAASYMEKADEELALATGSDLA
jgi:hypothetical protein